MLRTINTSTSSLQLWEGGVIIALLYQEGKLRDRGSGSSQPHAAKSKRSQELNPGNPTPGCGLLAAKASCASIYSRGSQGRYSECVTWQLTPSAWCLARSSCSVDAGPRCCPANLFSGDGGCGAQAGASSWRKAPPSFLTKLHSADYTVWDSLPMAPVFLPSAI